NIIVTVNPNPVVSITASANTICAGDTAVLIASSNLGGTGFSWNNGLNGDTISISAINTTTYTVIGNALGCRDTASTTITVNELPVVTVNNPVICWGETATLTATSTVNGSHYTWYPSLDTLNPYSVNPVITTTYTVIGAKLGCSDTATATVTVHPLPNITVNNPVICMGFDANLIANGGVSYVWNDGNSGSPYVVSPFQTTTFYVTGTDANNCSDSATAIVTVHPNPIVNVNNAAICFGHDANLTATGAVNYIWNDGNNGNPYIVSPFQTTTFYVTGTDANNCSDSATAIVTVNPNPTITISSVPICSGATASLTAAGAATYVWNTGATSNPLVVTPSVTTNYTVTGTNTFGCVSTANANATVYPIPIIDFNANPWGAEVETPIIFTGNSNVPITQWQWDFGDSYTDNSGVVVTHSYVNDGEFEVTLTVTSDHTCVNSITHPVVIELSLQFPNVFTPNGDGVNDKFEIVGLKPEKENKLEVFNRWGKKVYEKSSYDNSWSGEGASDGTYYFIFTWKSYTLGREASYSGSVMILR
ncbi:MAG: gliding motility-associated C-terminal domain-containing protein, partial [Bacteroidota bacterium]